MATHLIQPRYTPIGLVCLSLTSFCLYQRAESFVHPVRLNTNNNNYHPFFKSLELETPKQQQHHNHRPTNLFFLRDATGETLPSRHNQQIIQTTSSRLTASPNDDDDEQQPAAPPGIDINTDAKLYKLILPRTPGIEWGTDLSFSFVYVRTLEPSGPASLSGQVATGDQICQIRPVLPPSEDNDGTDVLGDPVNLVGAPFDGVMNSFASLPLTVKEVELVFFSGTKQELITAASGDGAGGGEEDDSVVITVVQDKDGVKETVRRFRVKKGCNVRQTLVEEGINVYQSVTRWTNCKGKQLCGTCIVNIAEGGGNTNRKSMDEESTLRENPDGYRLSCVTFAYGDVTVETFPPIKAAQWTR